MASVQQAPAQVVVGGQEKSQITITNGVAVGSNAGAEVNPLAIRPNLGASNATPAIGRSEMRPAIPRTNSPALSGANPERGFTTAIGQQGSGTAIGQQGSGTAIGQQGSGTAIGQQGVGTAIIPQNNAIVIGQPEPFSPPPVHPMGNPHASGVRTNMPAGFGNRTVTNAGKMGVRPNPTSTPPTPEPSGRR